MKTDKQFKTINREEFPMIMKVSDIRRVGISKPLYYKLLKTKQLPYLKINNRFYVNRDALFDYIDDITITVENYESSNDLSKPD